MNRQQHPQIARLAAAALPVLALALASSAYAAPQQEAAPVSSPAAAASIDRPDHPLARKLAREAANTLPAPMRDMLSAQNAYRARSDLPPFAWSFELEEQADLLVERISGRTCSAWAADALTAEEGASFYWAPAVRGIGGSATPQDLSARFVASEWEQGARDYSSADGVCMRDTRTCGAYASMMAPDARFIGCDYLVCSTAAQVWVCQYGGLPGTDAQANADAAAPPG